MRLKALATFRLALLLACGFVASALGQPQSATISVATLNCYWFMGVETYRDAEAPRTKAEHELKTIGAVRV